MIIFPFLVAYCFAKIFKLISYAIIVICTIIIIDKIYQHGKTMYVLKRIDNVYKIEISQPTQIYKEVKEKSGVSIGYYYTEHYRIKYVPYKKIWKAKAYFKNGKSLFFEIKENSKAYNEIIDKV